MSQRQKTKHNQKLLENTIKRQQHTTRTLLTSVLESVATADQPPVLGSQLQFFESRLRNVCKGTERKSSYF